MFELFNDVQKELKLASREIDGAQGTTNISPAQKHFVPEEMSADTSPPSGRSPAFRQNRSDLLAGLEYRIEKCEEFGK